MKLAKRFAAMALAALLSVSMLTACGDSGTSTASAEEKINQMVSNKSLNLTQSLNNATAYTITGTITVGTESTEVYSAKSGSNSYLKLECTYKGAAMVSETLTVDNCEYSRTYTTSSASSAKWSKSTSGSTSTSTYTNPEKGKATYKGSEYYTEKFTTTNTTNTTNTGTVTTCYFDADGNIKYMIDVSGGKTTELAIKTFKTTCDINFAEKKSAAESNLKTSGGES